MIRLYPLTLKTKIVVIHSGGTANHVLRDETADKIFKYNNLELSNSFAIWAKSFPNLPILEGTQKRRGI